MDTTSYTADDDLSFLFKLLLHTCVEESRIFYVYGGAVRDILRGCVPRDYDIYIHDYKNLEHFINFLKTSDRLRKLTRHQDSYPTLSIVVQTNNTTQCLVDIVTCSSADNRCDFTCNNLVLTREGHIATRVAPTDSYYTPTGSWLSQCINDAVNTKLRYVPSPSLRSHVNIKATFEQERSTAARLEKMVAYGYTLDKNTQCFPRLLQPTSTSEESCPVCKETYTGYHNVVVLKCGHDFHVNCIDKWVNTGRYYSTNCPVCRQSIQLAYTSAV